MAIHSGTRLGPYEILSAIGAGGMGEVYKALDTRLDRTVAIKVLPEHLADKPELRERFEREARTIGSLNHPHICSLYDIGCQDGIDFLVMEYLEGETLATRLLKGPLPLDQLLGYAIEISDALDKAHRKGVTHRDLKPGNVMLTKNGTKLLDFGLAKLRQTAAPADVLFSQIPTLRETPTVEGTILGTLQYMAPEQVEGKVDEIDGRTDIFAFGAVVYEMATGKKAFEAKSTASLIARILEHDPPPMSTLQPLTPSVLDRVVKRCLAKDPEGRFHSAHDLSFALAMSGGSEPAPLATVTSPSGLSRRQILKGGAAALGLFGGGLGVGALVRRSNSVTTPSYQRVTFRQGLIRTARFAPDYQTILYGALWDGDVCRVYSVRPDSPESAPLDLPPAAPLAVSTSGELALALGTHFRGVMPYGTLARVPLVGGAPRELLEEVKYADWSPDGTELAVVRRVEGREQLEFPLGNVVAEPSVPGGGFSFPRVAADGNRVAFFELTRATGLNGSVGIADRRAGQKRIISRQYFNVFGLAWKGDEIWFTAADERPLFRDAIHAVTADGTARVVGRVPGNVSLHEVAPGGRILMARTADRVGIAIQAPGDTLERDLSWLDASLLADISRDGSTLLFTEGGVGGGPQGSVYLRSTAGSRAVRLGDGRAVALSPDGRWAISAAYSGSSTSPYLDLLPTGPGQPRRIERQGLSFSYPYARWLLDGRRAVVYAQEEDGDPRLYVFDFESGRRDAITPEGVTVASSWLVSPNGTAVAVPSGLDVQIYPIGGGEPRAVPRLTSEALLAWIQDGLLVSDDPSGSLGRVFQINPASGQRQIWRDLQPRDPAGIMIMFSLVVMPDGRSYGYSWSRALSDLYLVDGFR
jgi:eukaryotic-like serine/threonine-protein kinase